MSQSLQDSLNAIDQTLQLVDPVNVATDPLREWSFSGTPVPTKAQLREIRRALRELKRQADAAMDALHVAIEEL